MKSRTAQLRLAATEECRTRVSRDTPAGGPVGLLTRTMIRAVLIAAGVALVAAVVFGAPSGHFGEMFAASFVLALLIYSIDRVNPLGAKARWGVARRSKLLGVLMVLFAKRK